MADMKKLLHTFDEADEILNGKIERTNLSTIVASATASVENKKTVLIRGTGRNIESLKVGGRTVQNGTPTPDAPVEVLGVGDKVVNLFKSYTSMSGYTDTSITFNGHPCITSSSRWYGATDGNLILSVGKTYYIRAMVMSKTSNMPFKICGSIGTATTDIKNFTATTPNTWYLIDTIYAPQNESRSIRIESISDGEVYISEFMVVESNEPVPYDKYKIPVSCGGETTNIYLDSPLFEGEVADLVNGKIDKKYGIVIFDGSENWQEATTGVSGVIRCRLSGDVLPNIASATNPTGLFFNIAQYITGTASKANEATYISGINIYPSSSVTANVNEFKELLSKTPLVVVYPLATPTTETFDTSPIPTTSGNNELALNTEVTPTSIDVTSFGDYYSKAEVDKLIDNMEKVIEYEDTVDVATTAATKIAFATMFPNVNKENVISLVVMTAPYTNDNITRYFDTLMALRITSTVNQKVAVRVRCVYK